MNLVLFDVTRAFFSFEKLNIIFFVSCFDLTGLCAEHYSLQHHSDAYGKGNSFYLVLDYKEVIVCWFPSIYHYLEWIHVGLWKRCSMSQRRSD